MRLAWFALIAGCYKPAHEHACAITCPCPAGLTCSAGVCVDSTGSCGGGVADARPIDAPPDAPLPDAHAGCFYARQGGFFDSIEFCVDGLGGTSFGGMISTDLTSSSCAFDSWGLGNNFCVIIGSTVGVSGAVTVTGARPLLIVAKSITLAGSLDATTYGNGGQGPGADAASCAVPSNGTDGMEGGTGGAGGSFGGVGGAGGGCNTLVGPSGVPAASRPTNLRGGCPGSDGGNQSGVTNRGHGGGAVYMLAETSIDLGSGAIFAGGEGGGTSTSGGGGGGGGSGGLLVFDAPSVATGTATVLANGGGGGGGSSSSVSGGAGGEQLSASAPGVAGIGDVSGGSGSMGGDGAPGRIGNGGSLGTGGGGGGGGGAGYILVFSASITGTGTFSPTPQ
jgi:hypothetical protein